MRIVQVNPVYDADAKTPNDLLNRYFTLTEWSTAVARAGAEVTVAQRFHTTATVERDGIRYEFVADKYSPWLSTDGAPLPFIDAIVKQAADVVHVNGLIFPGLVAAVRAKAPRAIIVVQHHGGEFPIRGSGLSGIWLRRRWHRGLASADALSFTAAEQAEPWRASGVLARQRVIEIVEASTTLRPVARDRARTAIGQDGSPLVLWVGRLTTNKDPLTVLEGLERALPQLPGARVLMVFGDDTLIESVESRVRGSALLADRVTLVGRLDRAELPNYYAAADVFISGSHYEGSGYALIEALSAGVVPVVTNIPSFRSIAGDIGGRWTPGDAEEFARVLLRVCASDLRAQREAAAARFDQVLSWDAIGKHTVAEYSALART
jgi:glycosyltransferase involved in cell wall biosynthesis